jgi:LPS sulfotransferase NodH
MSNRFEYFVVLAEMRTGSNFLEANLNAFDDLECHGELFNPVFIGSRKKSEKFGVDMAARENEPLVLLEKMRAQSKGMPGLRFFNDHDPRILGHMLADPSCAKIILTRNPLDSYVSLKIAAKTDQWKLADVTKRKSAKADFDLGEFEDHLAARQAFQLMILKALQRSGQTGFYIAYEDIQDIDVINGLGKFLGSEHSIEATPKATKKQNAGSLEDLVENHTDMVKGLASIDIFDLGRTPNFEPRRGPRVPSFVMASDAPLLFIPVAGQDDGPVRDWMAQLDGATLDKLRVNPTQKVLKDWQRQRPNHRSFTVIEHPVARAYAVFCDKILDRSDENFDEPRRVMAAKFDIVIPDDLADWNDSDMRKAFISFLRFLKLNLADQTSVRIDPVWASQTALLEGVCQITLPDMIIRQSELQTKLDQIATDLGKPSAQLKPARDISKLAEIYDETIEKLCRDAYRRDYLGFGFSDWSAQA